jgi:hypothetical protein
MTGWIEPGVFFVPLDAAVERGRFDLSDDESREFVERLLVGQIHALYYLAEQIDELKAAVRQR